MIFVKIIYTGKNYRSTEASDIKMDILGNFLTDDVGCLRSSFKEWGLDDDDVKTNSNITDLVKEDGYIYLSDLYSEEKVPTRLKMTKEQFIQILDDWRTKICKARPQEAIITYHNDQFIIETSNDCGMS